MVFAFHLYQYTDKTGHPTIGYGYNVSVYSYESKRIPNRRRMGF
ncbi:hypothetical protein [Helicobacter pylori]|nr:hypothetical protein [Helicobacter pylori]